MQPERSREIKLNNAQIRRRTSAYILLPVALLLGGILLRPMAWRGSAELHTLLECIATVLRCSQGLWR